HVPPPFSPLSLHDALPISVALPLHMMRGPCAEHAGADDGHMILHAAPVGLRDGWRNGSAARPNQERAARHVELRRVRRLAAASLDRKSTRLNSSHEWISYA